MKITRDLYSHNLSLLTDLYQLTMAYGYWKTNIIEKEAVFNMFFRKNPFKGGYSVACGLDYVIDFLENFRFEYDDVEFLKTVHGNDGKPLFEQEFLDYLLDMEFRCDIDAIPEGNVVFPHEPLIRVHGPLIQCQLLETALLNIINFQTLIATKASRVCHAANGKSVLEFGLRRAQGIDGALAASRAAFIGGCDATSNVLAAKLFGIPLKGTHAHSWVMSFDSELEAFEKYAHALPNNCVFLVDTYDTVEGVHNAVKVGKQLREKGYEMTGIRLDSGDLAYLSNQARKILDEGGFPNAVIVASNDLDELIIDSLQQQDAKIDVWGVGTKLVTGDEQPALGGVYKIAAIREDGGNWGYKVKLSEQAIKISNPGVQQVRRFYNNGEAIADMIYDETYPPVNQNVIVDPMDMTRRKTIPMDSEFRDMLVPIFRKGKKVYESPDTATIRETAIREINAIHKSIRRFSNPHAYPVGLEKQLYDLKTDIILKLRSHK